MDSPTKQKAQELCKDLENWMSNLPIHLRSVSLIHLAIPGSHDSMTWSINRKSPMSPDAEPLLQRLRFLGSMLGYVMSRWSITQSYDVLAQLNSGIRYFDLRIATKTGTEQLYFVHGLYADDVRSPLSEIQTFLETHPREVVILDCQHFYAFGQSDHETFMRLLTSTFGHKLLPYTQHMDHITLEFMTTQFRYQVIVIYRSDAARFGQPLLWPAASWPTPWPNTISINKLFTTLDENLKSRSASKGYVSQCLLTPTTWFVCKHVFGTLKSECAVPLEKHTLSWIERQRPGGSGVNIIISDFIGMSETQFSKIVIGINAKLLAESSSPT
ncbi:uncharacterized protein CBL_13379 [Carabus blaptoides fortunei]